MIKKLLFSFSCFLGIFNIYAQASLNFDGVNDVVTAANPPISGNASRTVEAWIKTTKNSLPTSSGGLGQSVIVDWGTQATSSRFTLNLLFNNAIRLEVQGNGLSGNIPINDGNWHHVAATYNSSSNPSVYLYVDGNLDVSGNLTVAVNTTSTGNLKIGQRVDGISPFLGSIDEVKIWNFSKTQAQIQADKNKEFCATQTGLVAYYKFNEGVPAGANSSVTIINDYSGNNNNGTVSGFAMTGSTSNYDNSTSNLVLTTLDNGVSANNQFLTANQAGATYQWYNCDTQTPIAGATSQSYTAPSIGNYSVFVNLKGCMKMSNCVAVTSLGVKDLDFNESLKIYPNPSEGEFNINLGKNNSVVKVMVYDASGKTIKKQTYENVNELKLDFDAPKGTYYLQLINENGDIAQTKISKK